MVTLISAHNSEGCYGRCDAKCYNAVGEKCDCICGGVNHGAGRKKAVENTNELAEGWMKKYSELHPEVIRYDVNYLDPNPPKQLDLFSLLEV